MPRPAPIEQLRAKLARPSRLILGAAIGTGVAARAVESGGADFVMTTSAARFRIMGQHPVASFLPLGDANELVWSFARQEMVSVVKIPIILGVSVLDPNVSIEKLLGQARAAGFAGVVNSPTAIDFPENLRMEAQRYGLGFERELEMLAAARRQGLLTFGFAQTLEQSAALTDIGVDVICLTFGVSIGGMLAGRNLMPTTEMVELIQQVVALAAQARPSCIIDAGPIFSPDEMIKICRISGANGYLGRSSPAGKTLETSITEFMATHKSLARPAVAATGSNETLSSFGNKMGMLGNSALIHDVLHVVQKAAASDLSVLIRGENGTGKELVAHALHANSRRATRPMVTVNCAALPHELLESELFGYEAGAFSGAVKARIGRFEEADGSTLFLDEIAELELPLQAKLLRVLEGGDFQRLGSNKSRFSDARIICATNKDLADLSRKELFRQDLMYRLNTIEIVIPSLRERMEDVPLLARHFLERLQKMGHGVRGFDDTALRKLMTHSWPGNIRELRNAVERAVIMSDGKLITARDLPQFERTEAIDSGIHYESERDWIMGALYRNRYRRAETARELGMSRKTLYNKIRRYGLETKASE